MVIITGVYTLVLRDSDPLAPKDVKEVEDLVLDSLPDTHQGWRMTSHSRRQVVALDDPSNPWTTHAWDVLAEQVLTDIEAQPCPLCLRVGEGL